MKARIGFVSNSSSSSFIIAVKRDGETRCPHCNRLNYNFLERVNSCYDPSEESRLRARGLQETLLELSDRSDDRYDELKTKLLDFDNQGYEIGWVQISYHNEWLRDEFQALRDAGLVEVILDDN